MVTKRMTEKRVNKLIKKAMVTFEMRTAALIAGAKKQEAIRKNLEFARNYGTGPEKLRRVMGFDSNSARFATPNGELTLTGSPEFIIEVLTKTGFIQSK